MLEAETGHAGGQEQGCVEVRAAGELRLFETADGSAVGAAGCVHVDGDRWW